MTRMIAFGDSTLEGWDGHEDVPRDRTIPKTIGKINGWDVNNRAIGGTKFGGQNSFVMMTAQTNFFAYDVVLAGYGVNDWCYPEALSVEKSNIQQGIQNIRNTNPNIPILFELPTEDFRNGSTSLDDKNSKGWSQNDMCDLIVEVAEANGCQYYDWRTDPLITYANHTTTLGDGQVHPTQATMDAMAQRLAPVIKSLVPSEQLMPSHDGKPKPEEPDDNQPSSHTKKIHLATLEDVFGIGDNVNQNVSTSVKAINEIYSRIAGMYFMEAQKVDWSVKYDNASSRQLRNGVIKVLRYEQELVNQLISFCNANGIIDMMIGKTAYISLDPPIMLRLDDDHYQSQYNQQWKIVETTLNKLFSYLEAAEGVD